MMYRPYIIIFTLVVLLSAQTAARNYFDLRLRNSRRKCNTSDIVLGKCVPYEECSRYNSPYTDFDFISTRVEEGPCLTLDSDVCCALNDVIINPQLHPEPIPSHGWCGWRNPRGIGYQSRISNGVTKLANDGEFPWTVVVLKETTRVEPKDKDDLSTYENLYLGGGSLIDLNVVLTAAHIVQGVPFLKVRAGEWDTQSNKEFFPHQDKTVDEVVIHKDFNRRNLFYDIALLILQTSIVLTPNVGVVCLPPARLRARAGSKCFASGWGMDKFGRQGQYQGVMKKSKADRYMQSGIVAWGLGCGDDGSPGVYVDVAELREWIDNEVAKKGISTDFYTFE